MLNDGVILVLFEKPFGTNVFVLDPKDAKKELDLMKNLGITWCRHFNFPWNETEPSKDALLFDHLDNIVNSYRESNMDLLPILWDTPTWAGNDP
jgi:hypothetical protein